jgi:PIN domain nuclease of toxin-antitoxin system
VNILLDTSVFLMIIQDSDRLSQNAKKLFLGEGNRFLMSLASVWEIFVKIGAGKLELTESPERFLRDQLDENGVELLPIRYEHTAGLLSLPSIHKDPFDRIIISQALHERLPVLSSDAVFADYGVRNLF